MDRAVDFESEGRRFESCRARYSGKYGPLAQMVEQQTLNLRVGGSNPPRLRWRRILLYKEGFFLYKARVVELADTLDLGSSALGLGGSSPPSRKYSLQKYPARLLPFYYSHPGKQLLS